MLLLIDLECHKSAIKAVCLNTSHVIVNRGMENSSLCRDIRLNTSHVIVNPDGADAGKFLFHSLNTSHVIVNRFVATLQVLLYPV